MKQEKAFDLTYLIEFSADDRAFIREMIETFLEKTPYDMERLQTALADSNWTVVREVAHKMKPSVTFLGLHALKDDVATLEQVVKEEGSTEIIQTLGRKVVTVCRRAIEELRVELLVYVA